jgi:hypothetical protein
MKCTGNTVLAIFAALVVLAIAGVAIAGIVSKHSTEPILRYCFNQNNGDILGMLQLDSIEYKLQWDIQHNAAVLGPILSIHLVGPVPAGSKLTGPLHVALCGVPSLLACDISVLNAVSGTIVETSPGGLALKTAIQTIRETPWKFFIRINTATMSGEFEAHLTATCGTI